MDPRPCLLRNNDLFDKDDRHSRVQIGISHITAASDAALA